MINSGWEGGSIGSRATANLGLEDGVGVHEAEKMERAAEAERH